MGYRHERERHDYSDLAAGRVLLSAPGATAFPVRLGSELAQRAFAHAEAHRPLVYDPCCGSGYLLSVIGFLHGDRIAGLIGSDISADAMALCERNLALLDAPGLDARIAKLRHDVAAFGKDSHREALASAQRLRQLLPGDLPRRTFVADVGDRDGVRAGLNALEPDVVITDVPYGATSGWSGGAAAGGLTVLLDSLSSILRPGTVVAIASSKPERQTHEQYERLERWQVGKRALTILRR